MARKRIIESKTRETPEERREKNKLRMRRARAAEREARAKAGDKRAAQDLAREAAADRRPRQHKLGNENAPVGALIEPPDVEGEEVTVTRVKRRARYFRASMTAEACIMLLQASRDSRLLAVGKTMSVKNQRETYIPEGAYEADREKLLRAFLDHGELLRHRALHGAKPMAVSP